MAAIVVAVSVAICVAGGPVRAQSFEAFAVPSVPSVAAEAIPSVTITAPTSDSTYGLGTGPVALGGTTAGGVTQVTWASDRGVAGVAYGTAEWWIEAVPLQPGPNVITVTARDASDRLASATLTLYAADVPVPAPEAVSGTGPAVTDGTRSDVTVLAPSPAAIGAAPPSAPLGSTVTSGSTMASGPSSGAAAGTGSTATSAGQPGLVAAYAFDEGAGATVADLSGNNNTGTLSGGVSWTSQGRLGSALVFRGAGMVTVPHDPSLALATGMTVEAWVYPTATPTHWMTILLKELDDQPAYALHGGSPTGRPSARYSTASHAEDTVNGPRLLALDTWTHLAVTFDGIALRLYVDGTQVASRPGAGPIIASAGALRIGGSPVGRQYFRGRIDEVRVYNRALSVAEIQTDMVRPISSGTPPPDITPPSVAVTSPGNGGTVFGMVSVSASASDNVGVTGLQFRVDGNPLGDELADPPYTVTWDTSAGTTGQHVVTAVARDAAGNTKTSAPVQVTVSPNTPAALGQWQGPFATPIVTVHATLLSSGPNTGQVLVWDALGNGGDVHLWDPVTNTFTAGANAPSNIFCSGHCVLPDGRVFVAGGHISSHEGLADANIFDPVTGTWSPRAPMRWARWYPTATTLPDGRVLVTAGENGCSLCNVDWLEIYNPASNTWATLSGARLDLPFYPHMFVLPDGRVLAASSTEGIIVSQILDVTAQTWSVVDPVAVDGGSAVMYRPGKIMKSGTHNDADMPTVPSAATTYVLDMTQPSPAWTETASMAFPRGYHNLTVLPDGQVLVTGGGVTTDAVGLGGAVLDAEMWSPTTQTWTTMARMQRPRLYHSIALLLPDARVLVSGGGRFFGQSDPTDQLSLEIYSPPYLFKGTRPVITTAPATAGYNTTMSVQSPDAGRIASVALVKPGTVTHSFNREQRFVPVTFTVSGATLTVNTPLDAKVATPGTYMLFLVDTSGVPSVAKLVRLQ